MASLRKKYQSVETPTAHNDAPIASTPVVQAAEPPPAVETKPVEPPAEKQSPADKAADDALRQRLAEMTRAEGLQREAMQQGEHRLAAEPPQQPQQQQAMSAHVQEWLSKHPQFFNDAVAQAELNVATMKCVRDGLTWNDDNFIPTIERHLGFRQQPQPQQRQPQPNGNGHAPASGPAPQRNGAQLRQQRPAGPVSAPPSRDAPSMATGRATGHRAPLSEAEAEIARSSGLSLEEYQQQKEKMLRLKAAGAVQ
jgi:hypothetical protein